MVYIIYKYNSKASMNLHSYWRIDRVRLENDPEVLGSAPRSCRISTREVRVLTKSLNRISLPGNERKLWSDCSTFEKEVCVASKQGSGLAGSIESTQAVRNAAFIGTASVISVDEPQFCGLALVVDDNKLNQLVLAGMLKKIGIASDIAANGIEAVEKMTGTRYDVVFMDCHMPEMDGFAATRLIRALPDSAASRRTTPVIAVTSDDSIECRQECGNVGMNAHMTKPFRRNDLEQVIARNVSTLQKQFDAFRRSA